MKKIMALIFSIVVLSFNGLVLNASCEDDKNDVEMVTYLTAPVFYDGKFELEIEMYGLSKDMYVDIFSGFDGNTIRSTSLDREEVDGVLFATINDIPSSSDYRITIYSNSCGTEPIKIFDYSYKNLNKYAYSDFCLTEDGYKSDTCNVFSDTEDMTEEQAKKKVEKEIKNYDFRVNIKSSIKNYYLFVLIPILVVVVIFAVRIYLLKKKQKEKVK